MSEIESLKSELENVVSLSTQLDKCDDSAAVFYHLSNTQKAKQTFKERLFKSKSSCIFVLGSMQIEDARVHCLDKMQFDEIQSYALEKFYPVPNKEFYAITGTNGKTSTVHLLGQMIQQHKRNVLTIGTLGSKINGRLIQDDGLTTPGVCELRRLLYEKQNDYDVVVMEVSSHALDQKRVDGLNFDCAGWTNLTQDHLDYHKTLEQYFAAKLLIARYIKNSGTLYVSDEKILSKIRQYYKNAELAHRCNAENLPLELSTPFSRSNLGLALAMAHHGGYQNVGLNQLSAPPGRFQIFTHADITVVVDYAHTPDALVNACLGVKEAYPQAKLTVVFGCGGDRDRTKRPLMAQAAQANSDHCIVTSDNPRTENPLQIIQDILPGFSREVLIEKDRKSAIFLSLNQAKAGDVILIAGKGHETYQEINGVKHDFDDLNVVKSFWKRDD